LNFIFYLSVRNGYNVKTKIPDLKSWVVLFGIQTLSVLLMQFTVISYNYDSDKKSGLNALLSFLFSFRRSCVSEFTIQSLCILTMFREHWREFERKKKNK
jgi:hypothetical protein